MRIDEINNKVMTPKMKLWLEEFNIPLDVCDVNFGRVDVNFPFDNKNIDFFHEEYTVDLRGFSFGKFPIKFGDITGSFICTESLQTLEGGPTTVNYGNFVASNTNITSLEHCPEYVMGDFMCRNTPRLVDPYEFRYALLCQIEGEFECSHRSINAIFGKLSWEVGERKTQIFEAMEKLKNLQKECGMLFR